MNTRWKILLGIVFASIMLGIFVYALKLMQPKRSLPIINPSHINPSLVAPDFQRMGRGHRVGDFRLIDHLGNTVDSSLVSNRIRVVEFFFTTCPSICKVMTDELLRVQTAFHHEDRLMILSHTVMPEVDSVETLAAYAQTKGINAQRWRLLTGDKTEIYRMAREAYFIAPEPQDNPYSVGDDHDFIHTENIALVDEKGRIRGYYDGTDTDEMNQLIEDIQLLLNLNAN